MESATKRPARHLPFGWEQKEGYQRRMWWSMCSVYVPILVLILIFSVLPKRVPERQPAIPTGIESDSVPTSVGAAERESPQDDSADGSGGTGSMAWLLPRDFPNGFISNIRIIRDEPLGVESPHASIVHDSHGPILDIDEAHFDPRLISFTAGDGTDDWIGDGSGDDDFGLPPSRYYGPIRSLSFPDSKRSIEIPADQTTQDAQIVAQGGPGWPRKGTATDSAVVVVQFVIKPNGTLKNFNILEEHPRGLGFADQLINWIDTFFVRPGKVKGENIETTTTVKYTFVASGGQMTVTSTGNIEFETDTDW